LKETRKTNKLSGFCFFKVFQKEIFQSFSKRSFSKFFDYKFFKKTDSQNLTSSPTYYKYKQLPKNMQGKNAFKIKKVPTLVYI
jgi:hypothetical protein